VREGLGQGKRERKGKGKMGKGEERGKLGNSALVIGGGIDAPNMTVGLGVLARILASQLKSLTAAGVKSQNLG